MTQLMQALHDRFYIPPEFKTLSHEADECHRSLIQTLSRADRKLLLRIIDIKDSIAEQQTLDSFIRGFQLAAQMAFELKAFSQEHNVTDGPCYIRDSCDKREKEEKE